MFPRRVELRERVGRIVAVHAVIGGGLTGGALVAMLAHRLGPHVSPSGEEAMALAAAVVVSTGLLSAAVFRFALEVEGAEVVRRAFAASVIAAVVNVPLAIYVFGLGGLVVHAHEITIDGALDVLGIIGVGALVGFIATLPGLIVSVPLGIVYAIAYALVCRAVRRDLDAPTLRSVARAHGVGGAVLVVSAAVVGGVATDLGPVALAPAALLVALALGDVLVLWGEEVRLATLEAALRQHQHPTLVLCDPALSEVGDGVVPLDAPGDLAIVAREQIGSAYRERPAALALL